jgi:hypothetical protein
MSADSATPLGGAIFRRQSSLTKLLTLTVVAQVFAKLSHEFVFAAHHTRTHTAQPKQKKDELFD